MTDQNLAVQIFAVAGVGEVGPGDDLPAVLVGALEGQVRSGDVVVVASKVVAKAQGRTVTPPDGMSADDARRRLASAHELVATAPGVTVVRTAEGWVCANAGIDASNVPGDRLLLLPEDPDGAADEVRVAVRERLGMRVGVVVTDTFGRAWREGQTDIALGAAGIRPLRDERGTHDRQGRPLSVTLVAVADQIAGAADLVRDKAAGVPVVLVRGLDHMVTDDAGPGARLLIRPRRSDLFAHGRGWLGHRLADRAAAPSDGPGERSWGAASPPDRPARDGWPTEDELRLAAAAVSSSARWLELTPTGRVPVDDGLAAGRAEAVLLDLGYDASALLDDGGWHVQVTLWDPVRH